MAVLTVRYAENNGHRYVDLPTYRVIGAYDEPDVGLVRVRVPDAYVVDGELSEPAIRRMYRGQGDIDNTSLASRLEKVRANAKSSFISGNV